MTSLETMKGLAAIVLALAVTVYADISSTEDLTLNNYHMRIGIPEAARIKRLEEQDSIRLERIVGGSITEISQIPYQVGLLIQILYVFTSVCGGSIIAADRVLTAAHCYDDGIYTAQGFTAVLGSNTLFTGGTRIETFDITIHPDWDYTTAANDIAVLRITPVTFSNVIQPIALPSGEEINNNFVGQAALASGYGITTDGANILQSQRLSSVNMPIISNAECAITFGPFVHATNICASGEGGRSTCSGDSGGPLAVLSGGRRVLVGVTSYGARAGCQLFFPAAFARVGSFIPWILDQ